MDLGEVYRQYVEELSPEGGGYIVVKDGNGDGDPPSEAGDDPI